MPEKEEVLKKRVLELAEKSYRSNQYCFLGFLSPAEYALAIETLEKNGYRQYDSFGGTDFSERVMIRFGSEKEFGYLEDYPFVCIIVRPNLAKFADALSHRDFLGSILNLGIERDIIGDILIRENIGYVMCHKKMAEYVAENLKKIKHTYVKCSITGEMPDALQPVFAEEILSVGSKRCDMVLAKLYHISRSESLELFRAKKICVNSRIEESNSRNLKEGDVVSARGHGKFIYEGIQSVNKKEKLRVLVKKYV